MTPAGLVAHIVRVRHLAGNTGRESKNLCVIPIGQRQRNDGYLVNGSTAGDILRLKNFGGGSDGDFLHDVADLQGQVHSGRGGGRHR